MILTGDDRSDGLEGQIRDEAAWGAETLPAGSVKMRPWHILVWYLKREVRHGLVGQVRDDEPHQWRGNCERRKVTS